MKEADKYHGVILLKLAFVIFSFLEEESCIPPLQVSNPSDILTATLARPSKSDFCAFDADIGIDCFLSIFLLISSVRY